MRFSLLAPCLSVSLLSQRARAQTDPSEALITRLRDGLRGGARVPLRPLLPASGDGLLDGHRLLLRALSGRLFRVSSERF